VTDKPSKLQPAIIGGLLLGILSSIPFINLVNLCCCLWVVLGGAIAARALISRSPVYPVTTGEGATVGAMAGLVGSVITLVIGVPLGLLLGEGIPIALLQWFAGVINDPNASRQIQQTIEEMQRQAQHQPMAQKIMSNLFFWLIGSVIQIGFATLGGIIGVALFEKRKGQPPPHEPPWGQPPGTPGLAPPGPPPGPPPGQAPYGGGEPPRY
jgi:hypothetical protein